MFFQAFPEWKKRRYEAFSKQQPLFYVLYLGRVVCLIRHTNISPFWRVEQKKWKNVCYLYISYFVGGIVHIVQ
jgi:hypothetical protein